MQVSVETTSELSRKMTVQVPEENIEAKVAAKIASLAKDIRIDGFRPGKVPRKLIVKRYGGRLRQEVLAELIESSFYDALQEEKLKIAGAPQITPQELKEGSGLEYIADFEICPDVELQPVEELKVNRYVANVTDSDIDTVIEQFREQKKSWRSVDRPAQEKDSVTIHFSGSTDEGEFTGGRIENYRVSIDSQQSVLGFEEKLVGAEKGAKLDVEQDYPDDHVNSKIAGKSARFEIDVVGVEEGELPEVDADFMKEFGVEDGDLDAFRKDIKESMERQREHAARELVKTEVMNGLYRQNPLNLPRVMIDTEIDHLLASLKEARAQNPGAGGEPSREKLEEDAKRRVSLGLVLAEIIKQNNLRADNMKVHANIEKIAQNFEKPDEIIDWYYSNSQELKKVEQMVLEDEVVDWVLDKATVTEENVAYQRLMELQKNHA